jgi:hypothetical protein
VVKDGSLEVVEYKRCWNKVYLKVYTASVEWLQVSYSDAAAKLNSSAGLKGEKRRREAKKGAE